MFRKKSVYILSAALLLLIAGGLLFAWWPESQATREKAVCRIETWSCYALPVDEKDTIYLPLVENDVNRMLARPNDMENRVDMSAVFVSREGHLLTSDSLLLHCADTLAAEDARAKVLRMDTVVCKEESAIKDILKELDYYAKTHSVIDDGYNDVMEFRETLNRQTHRLDSLRGTFAKAIKSNKPLRARLHVKAQITFAHKDDSGRVAVEHEDAQLVHHSANGLLLFQTSSRLLPEGAKHIRMNRLFGSEEPTTLTAFADFGGATAHTFPETIEKSAVLPHSAEEGGLWSDAAGRACGIQLNGACSPTDAISTTLGALHCRIAWYWVNVRGWFREFFASARGKKEFLAKEQKQECICLHLPNGGHYNGQIVRKGKAFQREGSGAYTDSTGAVFAGAWQADTLTKGTRSDTLGIYTGKFNRSLKAEGMGVYISRKGERYEGEWKDGVRYGHGFSVKSGQTVRCGAWRNNRFWGERMVYTADRVYGIDLSRYQHEAGKKTYAIDWDRLRITSLGTGRRVSGQVDYPVSYIYLKATQGTRITNKYYGSDLRQARSHGIPVGSYHFYSAKYKGAEQASWFLRMAWIASTDLPPVLDLEPSEAEVKEMGGEEEMFRQVLIWLRTVEQKCGKKPVLYVGQQFVNDHLIHAPEALRNYDVWIARYGEYKPYVHLLHWQLTPYGRVRGIHGEVDVNVFNGTRTQFREYIDSICKK